MGGKVWWAEEEIWQRDARAWEEGPATTWPKNKINNWKNKHITRQTKRWSWECEGIV